MAEPVLELGGQCIEEGKVYTFRIKEKKLYEEPKHTINLLVVFSEGLHNLYEDIVQVSQGMGLRIKPQPCPLRVLTLKTIK